MIKALKALKARTDLNTHKRTKVQFHSSPVRGFGTFRDGIAHSPARHRAHAMTANVTRARAFAVAAHGEQRYGDQPYSVHLDAVAALLAPFGEEAQVVGYLHDVLEDTAVSPGQLRVESGERVAKLVSLVTDEPGANRRERKARSNAKMAAVTGEDSLALVVKAADRLANLRASAAGGSDSKLGMYRREHPDFRRAAYRPGLCDDLWREIDAIIDTKPA